MQEMLSSTHVDVRLHVVEMRIGSPFGSSSFCPEA